jgi:hypothetical protein
VIYVRISTEFFAIKFRASAVIEHGGDGKIFAAITDEISPVGL